MKTLIYLIVSAIGFIFTYGHALAFENDKYLQPAMQADSIIYDEDLEVNGMGRFNSVYIGSADPGVGGVTYFNGSVVNASTTDAGDGVPFTVGDDMRTDGSIWRGPLKGASDGMALKIADYLNPEVTGIYDFGASNYMWRNGYFSGDLTVGNLLGKGVVSGNNLTLEYQTGSAYDGRFVNMEGDNITGTLNINSMDSESIHATSTEDNNRAIYASSTGTLSRAGEFYADGDAGIAVGGIANGSGVTYGGHFRVNSPGGIAVWGHVNSSDIGQGIAGYFLTGASSGDAVYGRATHGTGNTIGGNFLSDSTAGIAVRGQVASSSAYSGDYSGGNFKISLGSEQKLEMHNLPAGTGLPVVISGNQLYYDSSSLRYKDNIVELDVETANVLKLSPVSFINNQTDEDDVGLVAEDVEELIPELVYKNEQGQPESVKYNRMPVYLLEVIKEQQKEIEQLKEGYEEDLKEAKSVICKKYPNEEVCN